MTGQPPAPARRPRRTGLVVGLVGIAAVLGVGATAVVRATTTEPAAAVESFVFDAQSPRLVVDVGSGEASVGRATGSRVEVTRTVRGNGQPELVETSGADGISLSAACDGAFFGGCDVAYDIRVPDGFTLDLRADSGTVGTAGTVVAAATLRVSSGRIDVADVTGPLVLEAETGGIRAARLTSETVSARATSGDVALDFATAPRTLDAEVASGDVTLALPGAGRYRVEVDADSGEERVSVPTDPGATSTVRVQSTSGDVTVRPH